MFMKKLLLSLCLGAACVCAFAQDPFGEEEVRADYKKYSAIKEVLTIKIDIAGAQTVTADTVSVTMIPFSGSVDCANFKGKVLPTGVDTQIGGPTSRTLSARYMIQGTDATGAECSIFIENNGNMREQFTHPVVVTDSKALSYLNGAPLLGKLDFSTGGLVIRIYCPLELVN